MERIINIENQNVGVKCSAGTVRTYRNLYGRDLISDMNLLEKELVETKTLTTSSEEIAENACYLMAKEYDNTLPQIDEWLSEFSPYFTYAIAAQCIIMWRENLKTLETTKKN